MATTLRIITSIVCVCFLSTISAKDAGRPRLRRILETTNITVGVGDNVKLPCHVVGTPRPYLNFYHENDLISHHDFRFKIRKHALQIKSVTEEDVGRYSCRAHNEHGELWVNFTLHVRHVAEVEDLEEEDYDYDGRNLKGPRPPMWASRKGRLHSVSRPVNSYVDFKCIAIGDPKPNITWFKDGELFQNSAMGKSEMLGWKLTIQELVPRDNGDYTCLIQNIYGSINWTFSLEVVHRLPHSPIFDGPKNQTAIEGETVKLNCKILVRNPHPHMQWVKHYMLNGSYKSDDGDPYMDVLQRSNLNKTNPEVLVIHNVTKDDAGWYTCVATNTVGMKYKSAWLEVLSKDSVEATTTQAPVCEKEQKRTTTIVIACCAVLTCVSVFSGIACIMRARRKQNLLRARNVRLSTA